MGYFPANTMAYDRHLFSHKHRERDAAHSIKNLRERHRTLHLKSERERHCALHLKLEKPFRSLLSSAALFGQKLRDTLPSSDNLLILHCSQWKEGLLLMGFF